MSIQGLFTLPEVKAMIAEGRVLLLAGHEDLLSQLPSGRWIAGTSVFFMSAQGGLMDNSRIFVSDMTPYAESVEIRSFTPDKLDTVGSYYPRNGFAVIVIPGLSPIHAAFAHDVQDYEGVFNVPLVGWVSGVDPERIGVESPKVFAGSGAALNNSAAVMFVTTAADTMTQIDTVNVFKQGNGDEIEFDVEGFDSAGDCRIGGVKRNLARYIIENRIDTTLPLVADYNGVMINVSVQSVDEKTGRVGFYAPVFKNTVYKFAEPVDDFIERFNQLFMKESEENVAFSCNCLLNYTCAELAGKKTGFFVGPVTFGEIAYIMLNRTLVFLSIEKMV